MRPEVMTATSPRVNGRGSRHRRRAADDRSASSDRPRAVALGGTVTGSAASTLSVFPRRSRKWSEPSLGRGRGRVPGADPASEPVVASASTLIRLPPEPFEPSEGRCAVPVGPVGPEPFGSVVPLPSGPTGPRGPVPFVPAPLADVPAPFAEVSALEEVLAFDVALSPLPPSLTAAEDAGAQYGAGALDAPPIVIPTTPKATPAAATRVNPDLAYMVGPFGGWPLRNPSDLVAFGLPTAPRTPVNAADRRKGYGRREEIGSAGAAQVLEGRRVAGTVAGGEPLGDCRRGAPRRRCRRTCTSRARRRWTCRIPRIARSRAPCSDGSTYSPSGSSNPSCVSSTLATAPGSDWIAHSPVTWTAA